MNQCWTVGNLPCFPHKWNLKDEALVLPRFNNCIVLFVKCILNESLGVWGADYVVFVENRKTVSIKREREILMKVWMGSDNNWSCERFKKIVNQRHGGCVKSEMRIGLFTSLIPIRLQGTFIKQEHAMLCLRLPDPCTFVSLIWLNNRYPAETLSVVAEREELLGT